MIPHLLSLTLKLDATFGIRFNSIINLIREEPAMNRQIRRRVAALVKKAEAKGIVLRKNDPSTPTLEELVVKLTEHGFKAPRQFQRPLSWKKSNKLKYFESVLMNRIEGSVVIVNVVKALAALKKATPSTDNEAYTNYN